MKVFYEKSINDKIDEEILLARSLNRKIDYIFFNKRRVV